MTSLPPCPPAPLATLVDALARPAEVRLVALSGDPQRLPAPGESDLDLFIYCTHLPAPDTRRAALAALGERAAGIEIARLAGGHWGQADFLFLEGVETWLMYFTLAAAQAELEAILSGRFPDRQEGDFYPLGRLAMYQKLAPLYDPDGLLAGFQARLAVYPPALAQTLLDYHLAGLADHEDFDRAVARRDVLFFHFALDRALDHFLQALFALNRAYFPSRKRSLELIAPFAQQPADCGPRLLEVVALAARAEGLGEARRRWDRLAAELVELVRRAENRP